MFEFIKSGRKQYEAVKAETPRVVTRIATTTGLTVGSIVGAASAHAAGAVTIPDSGVDMPGYIAAAGLALGAIVAAAIGVYFAYWGIKEGLKWMRKV